MSYEVENDSARTPPSTPARALADTLSRAPVAGPLDKLSGTSALDPLIGPLRSAVRGLPLGPARDVLHGGWLGHPLHPALVQFPMGAWMSAGVLDLLPGTHRSSRALVGAGLLAALPAALAGWTDWAEQRKPQMRTGLVHAASNSLAVGLYTASLAARMRGRRCRGKLLGFAGLAAAGGGALLGGHLAYRQGSGVNKTESVSDIVEPGWHALGRAEAYSLGRPSRTTLGEVPLLVVRESDGVRVLADRCSHEAGSLSGGEVADGCVTCPRHGSVFRLSDGWNLAGPATAPQPSFETRVRADGVLEVRLPDA
ncbi:DUF2231 domain-containing protein [Streptomyces iconiensis]|uniref:Rieske (2Fe-2S) protein n=1 Tax=Streptomyces iconiensis TaxID=1384038 RepID=A0ABT6ZZQ1_9ACTN|nr:Rieske (2Fe-2S) protein [Streptomyces iconiensis]MDJ1134554.1 Rieske (2Fe-2S) protein [Streptomyces iconiensis]